MATEIARGARSIARADLPKALRNPDAVPVRTVAERFPPGSMISRYVVLGEIGSGGMGVVLAAFDPELNRRVALKILPPTGGRRGDTTAQNRLMREAQAIARLSHPNVVAVYDVGRHERLVFVAMEFVDGITLSRWLADKKPSLAEIRHVFACAGRGLAAAHSAGIVHRDFKPENVLVSPDGRVRVLDFGLARADPTRSGTSLSSRDPDSGESAIPEFRWFSDSDVLSTQLTRDDTVVGTPRYMAPEQHAGISTDPRSDQFSFCVALYNALFGQFPFDATTLQELVDQKQEGRIAATPAAPHVPPWLEAAVLRGLSTDPARRFPSMDTLVAILERDPTISWRRRIGLGVAVLVVAGGVVTAFGMQRMAAASPCSDARERLAGVWDSSARGAVRNAIQSTAVPYAGETWRSVESDLDDYANAWVAASTAACEAAQVHHTDSPRTQQLRSACLDRSLAALKRHVAALRRPDPSAMEEVAGSTQSLLPPEACADHERLLDDPLLDEVGPDVEALRDKLDSAIPFEATGQYRHAVEVLRPALDEARALGRGPLLADALAAMGRLQEKLGQYSQAESHLREALWVAIRAGHDRRAVSAATSLVLVVGDRLARPTEGLAWADHAAALIDRVDPRRGDDREMTLERARLQRNLGTVVARQGDFSQARKHFTMARESLAVELGADHVQVGLGLLDCGALGVAAGYYEDAKLHFEEALKIIGDVEGPKHPDTVRALAGLAEVGLLLGQPEEAETDFLAARESLVALLGEAHVLVAQMDVGIGKALAAQGRYTEAQARLDDARRSLELTHGPDHPDVARVHVEIGAVLLAKGDVEIARKQQLRALQVRERAFGPEHREVAESLLRLSHLELVEGASTQAVSLARRALRIYEQIEAKPAVAAHARFALADALWTAGEATEAVEEARLVLKRLKEDAHGGPRLADVEAWLDEHPMPRPSAVP